MVTDLVEIRTLGTAKAAENLDFRRYLAAHHRRIEEFQAVATEIRNHIDCTKCANCCRHSIVALDDSDIARIASCLGTSPAQVIALYTDADPDTEEKRVLRSGEDGCVFLDGNLCMIYEGRPRACQDFPHTDPGMHTPGARMSSMCRWAALCPIIYNALEAYKHIVGYRRCDAEVSGVQHK
jgi:Fe-S-cluster containining protein